MSSELKTNYIFSTAHNTEIGPLLKEGYEKFLGYERFRFVHDLIEKELELINIKRGRLLDIGCSKGEWIYFLSHVFPQIRFNGIDSSKDLIVLAQSHPRLSNYHFQTYEVERFNERDSYDIVHMSGVHSIFDDLNLPFDCLVRAIAPGGLGVVFGMFNPYPVDVILRFKNLKKEEATWDSGLNNFSLSTAVTVLESLGVKNLTTHEFHLKQKIANDPDNAIRSFTHTLEDGSNIVTNGVGMIQNFYAIKFNK